MPERAAGWRAPADFDRLRRRGVATRPIAVPDQEAAQEPAGGPRKALHDRREIDS